MRKEHVHGDSNFEIALESSSIAVLHVVWPRQDKFRGRIWFLTEKVIKDAKDNHERMPKLEHWLDSNMGDSLHQKRYMPLGWEQH
mmetsp:Transcript_12659/g.18600  ORF Transcript_12659/g.18600 Transcript_12659/m.18600 type:complete len:85 (-) Transcript_12659:720-974(-)